MKNSSWRAGQAAQDVTYRTPWAILIVAAFGHLCLLVYDILNPDAFLRVDRARLRFPRVLETVDSASLSDLLNYLGSHGLIGDYAVHALFYSAGGRIAIICVQLLLLLLSAGAVFRLCESLSLSRRVCAIAVIAFLLLPHSIVFPHQLSSEAIHVPLLILSTWLTVLAFRRNSLKIILTAALLLAFATLVRPVTLLWPAVVGVLLCFLWKPSRGFYFAAMAFLPIVVWMTFVWKITGDFGLGESNASMDRNLYNRVRYISLTLPEEPRAQVEATYLNQGERGRLGALGYFKFGLQYPVPFAEHLARDSVAFFFKSGVERLTIDYFGNGESFRTLQDDEAGGWRVRLQQHGPIATFTYLLQTLGPIVIISAVGVLVMVGWLFLALFGAVQLIRHAKNLSLAQRLTALLSVLLPLYVFGISQVVDAMQSRLRAPSEFALVVLAAYGLSVCLQRFRARTLAPPESLRAQTT